MLQLLNTFLRDESGHDKLGFALIAAFVALLLLTSDRKLGQMISNEYNSIGSTISSLK